MAGNLDYPLTIHRGNTFERGFVFKNEGGEPLIFSSVVWTAGIGETIFVSKTLPVVDGAYTLSLTEDDTRNIYPNFRHELETDGQTYFAGPLTVLEGDNS